MEGKVRGNLGICLPFLSGWWHLARHSTIRGALVGDRVSRCQGNVRGLLQENNLRGNEGKKGEIKGRDGREGGKRGKLGYKGK